MHATNPFRTHLCRVLLFALCAAVLETGAAQEAGSGGGTPTSPELEVDETLISPLALPDTSSPRATLKSFIDNFDATFRPFHENRTTKIPDRESHTGLRSLRTFDTSRLPPSQAAHRAAEAALLLNEVMSRVDCYTDTGVWAEWHAIREDVYLRTLEIVKESGTSFAFPSQTTYFARDEGMDDEQRQAAEQQVAAWREAGELPFPDMTPDDREALTGTLDFPPEGSAVLESKQETKPERSG